MTVAVTPPTVDTEMMRDYLKARADGWTALEWVDDVDVYGAQMGRLTGVRVSKLEAAAYARGALDMQARAAAVARERAATIRLGATAAASYVELEHAAKGIEALDVEVPQ